MVDTSDELESVADDLAAFPNLSAAAALDGPMKALEKAAREVGRAWSGSSLGYHADVYTDDLRPPQRGDLFSAEWGLTEDTFSNPTNGYSRHDPEEVRQAILKRAGSPDLEVARKAINDIRNKLDKAKSTVESLISLEHDLRSDVFVTSKMSYIRVIQPRSQADLVQTLVPTPAGISSDIEALGGGRRAGPHHRLLALPLVYRAALAALSDLSEAVRELAVHIRRKEQRKARALPSSHSEQEPMNKRTHVFIGHGGSAVWKDLRDFIRDRVGLPFDEFNRVPMAGRSNKERLEEMLETAAIAFLVMTGEDETAAGKVQARQNVVHEAGLFQGRLGFNKAIVLLEEGCERFSNIDGLTDIRFPKANIAAAFEKVREVLEREGLLAASRPPSKIKWI